jgi:hypothetical protein
LRIKDIGDPAFYILGVFTMVWVLTVGKEGHDSETHDAGLAPNSIGPGTVLLLGLRKIPEPPRIDVFNGGRNGVFIPLKGILTSNWES